MVHIDTCYDTHLQENMIEVLCTLHWSGNVVWGCWLYSTWHLFYVSYALCTLLGPKGHMHPVLLEKKEKKKPWCSCTDVN